MNEITKKQRWVLVPCLDYDVPAMESWLEEQAMQGLFLSKDDGFFLGLACFESGAPRRVRYRLDAVPKEKAFSEFDEKKQAAIALAEEMGWEFVAEWKEFLIYRCDDAHLPELNTDPAVQALSLKRVQNALADRVFSTCYYLFLYQILLFLLQQPTFARRSDGWDHSVSGAGPGYHRADVGRGARLEQAAKAPQTFAVRRPHRAHGRLARGEKTLPCGQDHQAYLNCRLARSAC